ncbi:MAG: lipopolysaccharide assembly protein LapA domain-containing protein [Alphaproteobacteria bacterium]
MQYLTLVITLPITVFAVLLVLSNGTAVTLHLLPDDDVFALTLPLWQIALGLLGGGFFLGALFVWLLHQKARFRFWQESRKAARLEKELEKLHAEETARKDRDAAALAAPQTPAHISAQS